MRVRVLLLPPRDKLVVVNLAALIAARKRLSLIVRRMKVAPKTAEGRFPGVVDLLFVQRAGAVDIVAPPESFQPRLLLRANGPLSF